MTLYVMTMPTGEDTVRVFVSGYNIGHTTEMIEDYTALKSSVLDPVSIWNGSDKDVEIQVEDDDMLVCMDGYEVKTTHVATLLRILRLTHTRIEYNKDKNLYVKAKS